MKLALAVFCAVLACYQAQVPTWTLVGEKKECAGADGYVRLPTVDACASNCRGVASMFAFGTNDFGTPRCDDGGCLCLCEKSARADGTCDQVNHNGYRLYTFAKVCKDKATNCQRYLSRCKSMTILKTYCAKTCGFCNVGPPTAAPPTRVPGTLPPMGNCGVPEVQMSRVIGGTDSKRGAWPWQILMLKNGRAGCGGTLISSQWVVTAAHCVGGSDRQYKVRVGAWDRGVKESSAKDYQVKKVVAHPQWNRRTLDNDIALFYLEKPVIFSKWVKPACLPSKTLDPGSECYITGWGKTRHPGNMHMKKLQQAKMPVVDSKVCEAKNRKIIPLPITSGMICGGEGGVTKISGCHGDSGGPYVCKVNGKWELHGDVSHGSPRCESKETYTVFARTTYFKSWIEQEMKKTY